jgi:glycosyltransferase involved in cell wall biosynthesis
MTAHRAPYVVDGRFLAGRPTGLHRVARSFLTAARDAGVDAEVWAPSGTTDRLVDRIIRTPGGRVGGRLWEQVVLPAAAHGRPIWSLTNTAPLLAPGVIVVHDLAASVGPQWFAGSMRLYAATVLAGARRARLVITVSKAIRDELVNAGVRAERILVVAPAVDPRFTRATAEAIAGIRGRLGLARPYALLAGWADPRKDARTAVAAHQQVVGDLPHDLVLTGVAHPSFARVPLPELASVHRIGHVTDDDLVRLISGASVLLYPSRYEGFGLPPLEALSCGTPAVASDIPALRESTAGLVRLVRVGDVNGWAEALRAGLNGELGCPSPPKNPPAVMGQLLATALSNRAGASPNR